MSKINIIYLDMDGVLFNFVKGFCDRYELDYPTKLLDWNMEKELGLSKGSFYKMLNAMDYEDWYELKPIPHGFKLYMYLRGLGKEIYFCSSPSNNPQSWSAKRAKLQKYFPENARNTILMHDKYRLAKEDTLLIDDSQRNIDLFRAHGGNAIAFPYNHNENENIQDKSWFVRRLIEENGWDK